ncbi:MAG: serine hydrolase, partial [Clostridiales bacterium]|nr:serine hydrolase [Clostridiales bacterium]
QYCRAIGLTQTSLQRKMLDFQAIAEGRNNFTSPADLYRVFSRLYHGEILNKSLREVAFDFLSRCRSTDALQRYIPDAVTVLHKPGGLDYLNHDAGIFLTDDRPYYLGIFTWDGPALDGQPQQNRLIGQLSRMIYDAMKGEK